MLFTYCDRFNFIICKYVNFSQVLIVFERCINDSVIENSICGKGYSIFKGYPGGPENNL